MLSRATFFFLSYFWGRSGRICLPPPSLSPLFLQPCKASKAKQRHHCVGASLSKMKRECPAGCSGFFCILQFFATQMWAKPVGGQTQFWLGFRAVLFNSVLCLFQIKPLTNSFKCVSFVKMFLQIKWVYLCEGISAFPLLQIPPARESSSCPVFAFWPLGKPHTHSQALTHTLHSCTPSPPT